MLKLVEKVPVDLFSVADIKMHLRLDHDIENDYLKNLYCCAYDIVEQYLKKCLLKKTWNFIVDCTKNHVNKIRLPYSPLIDLLSIKQINQNSLSKKNIKRFFLDSKKEFLEVYSFSEKLEILYSAGFGEYPEQIPPALKQAVLLITTELYENRGNFVMENNNFLQTLLHPYRSFNFG